MAKNDGKKPIQDLSVRRALGNVNLLRNKPVVFEFLNHD